MADEELISLIKRLPKVELHIHIEGSFEPELMFEIAKRNGIQPGSTQFPYTSVEQVRAAYQFKNLGDFLKIYYQGASVLRETRDFYDLGMAYFRRAYADRVMHAEIFFDPQTHAANGVPYLTVVDGLSQAARDAQKEFGISSSLIHSFLRDLSVESAKESLEELRTHYKNPDYNIVAVGLDSAEVGNPPKKFKEVFDAARAMGLKTVAHAGEEGPPEYVVQALDILKVSRIDHGNRSLEDRALVSRLAREGMVLTVCPLSNVKLCGVDKIENHPIRRMLDLGLRVTCNSDDPSYFGGYMTDNMLALADAGHIQRDHALTLTRNAIMGSFASVERKKQLLAATKNIADRWLASQKPSSLHKCKL